MENATKWKGKCSLLACISISKATQRLSLKY